jgi:BMFP domain-containing protein YqiC
MSVKKIEEAVKQFFTNMPECVQDLPENTRAKIKEHLNNTLVKLDVVSREEFEVQKAILLKTREKLEALEKKLSER